MTPAVRAAVQRAQAAAVRLTSSARARPLDYVRWTPPQLAFLEDRAKRKLIRLGQQVGGKTTAGLAEVIWRCEGHHPYLGAIPHPVGRPYQAWVVCYSEAQSLQIQAKLAALLPAEVLEYKRKGRLVNEYRGIAAGFRGKYKTVTFPNGATIIFKTTKQGPQALASGTVDCILVDEPTSPECWGEVLGRVRRTGGVILLSLTPYGYPTEFLQAEVAAGMISDHRYDLTAENVTPQGGTGPLCTGEGVPMDEAWIAQQRATTPESIRGVVLDGHWEQRGVARYFSCFDARVGGAHITTGRPQGQVELRLGIDHGDRPGKQIAILLAVEYSSTREDAIYADKRARVWVLDEYTDPTGLASPADDARGILDMLARHGQRWTDLDYVMGDRVHMPGSARQKSNKDLQAQLGRLLSVPREALRPQIYTVKKTRGNLRDYVGSGARWIYQAIASGAFSIHPRCVKTIDALNKWTGPGPDTPEKDPIDALRYGLETVIYGGIKSEAAPEVRMH